MIPDDNLIGIQPSPEEKEDYWTKMKKNPLLWKVLRPDLTTEEKPAEPSKDETNAHTNSAALVVATWEEKNKRSKLYVFPSEMKDLTFAVIGIRGWTIDSLCSHEGVLYETGTGKIRHSSDGRVASLSPYNTGINHMCSDSRQGILFSRQEKIYCLVPNTTSNSNVFTFRAQPAAISHVRNIYIHEGKIHYVQAGKMWREEADGDVIVQDLPIVEDILVGIHSLNSKLYVVSKDVIYVTEPQHTQSVSQLFTDRIASSCVHNGTICTGEKMISGMAGNQSTLGSCINVHDIKNGTTTRIHSFPEEVITAMCSHTPEVKE